PGTPSSSTWPPASTATTSISTSSSCPTTALCISAMMRCANCCAVCAAPTTAEASGEAPYTAGKAFAAPPGVMIGAPPLSTSDKVAFPPELLQLLRQRKHFRLAAAPARRDLLAARHPLTQGLVVHAAALRSALG